MLPQERAPSRFLGGAGCEVPSDDAFPAGQGAGLQGAAP